MTKTTIRKIGNSIGLIIPSELLKQSDLNIGDRIDVEVRGDTVIITRIPSRRCYSLDELLEQCDENAPFPKELTAWV